MALTTIPSELSSVSGISDSSTSTAITIDSSQNVSFAGTITGTAATQAASDNSTKLATTAYVTTALANLVDSAPGTLNTLNELAAALGDDANFSTTVTNSIATKLPLAGGTMTGNIAHASDFTLDVGGDISLDADGGDIRLLDGGTQFGKFTRDGGDFLISSSENDKDIKFAGADGGANITALTLDMSDGGRALFGSSVALLSDTTQLQLGAGNDFQIGYDGTDAYLRNHSGGQIILRARTGFLFQANATGGGADNAIQVTQNGAVTLYHDGSAKLATTSAGINVTGNTQTDTLLIDAGGNIEFDFNGQSSAFTTGTSPRIFAGQGSSGSYLAGTLNFQTRPTGTRDINFVTGSSQTIRMVIGGSGTVLVGKTSSGLANNGVEFEAGQIKGTAANQTVAYLNRTGSDGDVIQFRRDNTPFGEISKSSTRFTIEGPDNPVRIATGTSNIQINHDTHITFDTASNEAMRIDASRNVGIGLTTGISSKLHVNTEMSLGPDANNRGIINYSSNTLSFGTRQSSTNYFNTVRITGGQVGIGPNASSPAQYLHLSDTSGSNDVGIAFTADYSFGMGIDSSNQGNFKISRLTTSLGTNDAFVIGRSTGYVGINTNTPDQLLEVANGNVFVGLEAATSNFSDSNSGNTHFVEIGANGGQGGDALFIAHASGRGVGYFGYTASPDRLVVACDYGGGANTIELSVDAGTTAGGNTDNLASASSSLTVNADGAKAVTLPQQPAFQVQKSSSQNSLAANGSPVTITFDTEIFDRAGNFYNNIFTSPVTGLYQFNVHIRVQAVDTGAGFYQIKIQTSNRTYIFTLDPNGFGEDLDYYSMAFGTLADMDASDTAKLTITQSGGTQQSNIHTESYFSGYLVA